MVSSEILFRGKRFYIERISEVVAEGQTHVREIIRHPGAVVILPLVDRECVCLIRNYRVAVNKWLVELPAGTREPNEPPDRTATRELREETGYEAENIAEIARFLASPGILDEEMILYVARGLSVTTPQREPGERIENMVVPWTTALQWVHDGTIIDAKTICGLLLGHNWMMRRGN